MKNNVRKNSIKSLIALFALSLVAVFVFPITAGANTVKAATINEPISSRETVEWEASFFGLSDIVINEDTITARTGTPSITNMIEGKNHNPYEYIIKKNIVIPTDKVQKLENGQTGNTFSARWDATPQSSAKKTPQVHMYGDGILIGSEFTRGITVANNTTNFKKTYNNSLKVVANVGYTVYFAVENEYASNGSVKAFNIYFKLVRISDGVVLIETTQKAPTSVTADHSEESWVVINGDSEIYYETGGSSTQKVQEYSTAGGQNVTFDIDEYTAEGDISKFWDWDKKIKANAEKGQRNVDDIEVNKTLTLTYGDYFYTPDFNNKFSFKLSVDNYNGYFTKSGGGKVIISLGQRYSATYFTLDYAKNTIGIDASKTSLSPKNAIKSFNLDEEKDYKVSIALRDVRDKNGVIVYRLAELEVVDMLNPARAESVKLLTNDLIAYTPSQTSTLETHFRVDDTSYGTSTGSHNMKCTLSSIERENWDRTYILTIEDENKVSLAELNYRDEYDFSSYISQKPAYELKGLKANIDGEEMDIPISGVWTTDIFTPTNGVYSATIKPVYEEKEYDLTYNVGQGANVVSGAPSKITMSDVLDLPEVENIPNGYVLIGWYADSAYTQKIEEITCEGGNVTVYAKVVQGYNFTLELPTGDVIIPMEKNATFDLSSVQVDGYNFTAWQEYNGSSYTNLTNNTVSATSNKTFKPVIEKTSYSITYNMNGGTNPASNKTSYTVDEEFTLETPEKEGYLFVKFVDESGNQVDKIAKGTLGNLTLEAVFVKDEFKATASVYVSTVAQEVPNFVIPETAYYTVAITFGGNALEVEDGKAVFGELGDYTAVYTIVLNGGKQISKTVTITSTKLTLTLDGAYDAQYALNTDLVLLDAFCQKETALVTVKVTKGGQEVEYKNFAIKLTELGVYTVTYTIEGEIADELSTTFEVVQKVANAKTPKTTTASIIDGGSGAGLLIACVGCVIGNRCGKSRDRNSYKNKKEKGEN